MEPQKRKRVPTWAILTGVGCTLAAGVIATTVVVLIVAADDCLGQTDTETLATLECGSGGPSLSLERTTTTNNFEGVSFSHLAFVLDRGGGDVAKLTAESLSYDEAIADAAMPPHVRAGNASGQALHVYLTGSGLSSAEMASVQTCLVANADRITDAADRAVPTAEATGHALVIWRAASSSEVSLSLEARGQEPWTLDQRGNLVTSTSYEDVGAISRIGDGWSFDARSPAVTEEALDAYHARDGRSLRQIFPNIEIVLGAPQR